MTMNLKSYDEWKTSGNTQEFLANADNLLEEAFVIIKNCAQEEGEGQETPCFISRCKIVEMSDILFKIESMQRMYQSSMDKGSDEEKAKVENILRGLFDLAHIKVEEAKEALFGGDGDKVVAPEDKDLGLDDSDELEDLEDLEAPQESPSEIEELPEPASEVETDLDDEVSLV